MSIAQTIQNHIKTMPPGQVFGYGDLPDYGLAPLAVAQAMSRMVSAGRLERLSKGKFYVPQKGILGPRKPSDSALIRSVLYKDGSLRGYVTGPALFNKLGLTTQVPKTVTLALEGWRQKKDFGTIRVKIVSSRFPVHEGDVKLIQYLDVLRDIKSVPDTDVNQTLKVMKNKIAALEETQRERSVWLAVKYDTPRVRALLGLLLTSTGMCIPSLKDTLNPTTVFKLSLDKDLWPMAKDWNIR